MCRSHRRRFQQAAHALHDLRKIGTLCRLPLPAVLHQRTVGVQAGKTGAVWAGQGVPLRDGRALPPRQPAHNLRPEVVEGRGRQGRCTRIDALPRVTVYSGANCNRAVHRQVKVKAVRATTAYSQRQGSKEERQPACQNSAPAHGICVWQEG